MTIEEIMKLVHEGNVESEIKEKDHGRKNFCLEQKALYDELLKVGFGEHQAIQIVVAVIQAAGM